MSVGDPAKLVRAPSEIAEAIRNLTPADWARLRRIADLHAMGRPIGGDDLLQEAFRRALDGERKCPISIDAVRFLAEAMRSIADGELKKTQRQPVLVPLPGPGDAETAIAEPADPRSTAEELIGGEQEADRLRSEILSLFNDDQIAQIIVEGIMEDIEGEELRSLTSLDKTQFDSKRRLIRRRISKYLRG